MKYISLGYFCSVAMDLERHGLRSESSPFDWLISDFEGVLSLMENHFEGFLNYDDLAQEPNNRAIYKNTRYNVSFYHDFDSLVPLREQLPEVQRKYDRRIDRFYNSITEPTFFIRYISDEDLVNGRSKELLWIEENYGSILALLKSFHPDNDILFIANEGVTSETIHIYHVERDRGDAVARNPLFKSKELYELFRALPCPGRAENLNRYKKQHHRLHRIKSKVTALFRKYFRKEYIHEKQC